MCPTVGKRQFPYSKKGVKQAKRYAKKTKKKLVIKKDVETLGL